MIRNAARAIVIKDDRLLVMRRNKHGEQYYALVGGGIDPGESAHQAVLREVREETGMDIANPRLVFIERAFGPFGDQYIYVCDYLTGDPALQSDSEEAAIHAGGKNLYEPLWLPIKELRKIDLLPETLKHAILDGLKSGWPAEPITLHTSGKTRYN